MQPDSDNGAGTPADDLVVAGRYRLIALAGAGGMGRVWRAHDDLLDRAVAVKEVLAPAALPDLDRAEILRRTVQEARAAARLDHPNVIRVFDVVRVAGRSWIVMEYVPSRSLHDVVAREGPLSHRRAARIGIALIDALRAAHRAGVLHLDVKPHNVLIADDGRVVLTDFGLATIMTVPVGPGEPLLGSPHYVAPERLRDGISGAPADLWSLGATLYAAVEGRPPFSRPDVAAALSALLNEAPDPPQHPGQLHEVIAGLLAPDPARRLNAVHTRAALVDITRRAVGVHAVAAPHRVTGSAVGYRSAATPPVGRTAGSPAGQGAGSGPDAGPFAGAGSGANAGPFAGAGPGRGSGVGRWRGVLVAGIASVVVAAVAGTLAVRAHDGDRPAAPASAAVLTPAADACAGGNARPATDSGKEAPISLPEGWLWHVDPAGFALAVPRGWLRSVTGDGVVCFGDPGGIRSFTVQAGGAVAGQPVRRWQDAERTALGDGSMPGYQKVSMGPLLITGGGADWEYSWQPGAGPRRHVYRMLLAAGDNRSYALTWTTRDRDWSLDLPIQRTLVTGFRDSAIPAVTWTVPGPRG
jgi:hypothetical protein